MGFRGNDRKGTGFTNINRVLQANQGNRLAPAVVTGVKNTAANVKTQTQQSQQKFEEEANKKRIDTEENAKKRDDIIGRFNETNYTPDMSKFQVSSGLQDRYNQNKQQLEQQRTEKQTAAQKQQEAIQARIQQDQENLRRAQSIDPNKSGSAMANMFARANQKNEIKSYQDSLNSLNAINAAFGKSSQAELQQIEKSITDLESQYGKMTEDEKEQFRQQEVDKLIQANLPTEEEISQFGKLRAGVYGGPMELQDAQTLMGSAAEAEQLGNLTRSTGGRQELLRRTVGGEDYTQGQQRLDTLLLGQAGTQGLNQARKATRGLETDVQEANRLAQEKAKTFASQAKIFGEETVGKLNEARNPLSAKIDEQLAGINTQEEKRKGTIKNIQDTLLGTGDKFKGVDRVARLGLGLQSAVDSGFLTQDQVSELMGKGGLVDRAEKLGLDTNALLNERIQTLGAQNINRGGAANASQEARISALDRLLGKQGTDVEFGQKGEDYKGTRAEFDTKSLQDYISKTEAERAQRDPQFAKEIQARPTRLQQTVGGVAQAGQALSGGAGLAGLGAGGVVAGSQLAAALGAGGASGALAGLGGAAAGPVALAAMLGQDALTGGDSTARAAEGAIQAGAGSYGLQAGARDSVLKGLVDLGLGDSETGKQLNKLLDTYSRYENLGLNEATKEAMNYADGFRDLTQTGRLDQALSKLTGADAIKNVAGNVSREVGKKVSTALFGGKTGNWATSDYNTLDANTGKKVKIGSFANKSSGEILNQLLSQHQIGKTAARGKGGNEGAKAANELLKYYNEALKREGKA